MGTSKQNEDTPKLSYNILQLRLSKPKKNKRNLRRGDWGREGRVMGNHTNSSTCNVKEPPPWAPWTALCPLPTWMKSNL
jgi:hypothetical protein